MHPLTSDYLIELALLEASRIQREAIEAKELPDELPPHPEEED